MIFCLNAQAQPCTPRKRVLPGLLGEDARHLPPTGQYRWNLKAGNGEVILSSEAYTTKAAAEDGVASVRTHGPDAANYERNDSTSGQPYFVLKASNGQTIGRSEMYSAPAARDNGIASVQKNSPSTTVKDLT